MISAAAVPFRFDGCRHAYIPLDTGEEIPHITGMLERTGWIDDRWYSSDSSERGQAVHALTATYDLGGLDPATCVSRYRPYLLGHVKAMQIIRPEWRHVEEPLVHPFLRFGGRPDRVGLIYRAQGVMEGKSGQPERSHQVQTALQAILAAPELGLPPEALVRYALYWRDNGRFKLEQHIDRRDFDEAHRVIKRCCNI
jgi:hypothetical protein